jgi:hypothetical protein
VAAYPQLGGDRAATASKSKTIPAAPVTVRSTRLGFHPSRSLPLLVVVAASLVLPGIAHLRLGAAVSGLVFLVLTAVLSAIQFAAPFVERPSVAVVFSGSAFAVGWLVSVVAARSAARLVRA